MKTTHIKTIQEIARLNYLQQKSHAAMIAKVRNVARSTISAQLEFLLQTGLVIKKNKDYLINTKLFKEIYFGREDCPVYNREFNRELVTNRIIYLAIVKVKDLEEINLRISEEILRG